jgi:hypothetical protein
MSEKKKTVDSDATTPNSEMAVIDLTGAEGSASGSALAPRKKRKGEQTTINGFIEQAMSGVQKNRADRKWLRYVISSNLLPALQLI